MRDYKRHSEFKGGLLSAVAADTLNREFEVDAPNKVLVTDFTYIRTHEETNPGQMYSITSNFSTTRRVYMATTTA